jgi:hypothetical protein
MMTQTTATSECSWVRAPADSPIAVRLPLLLTGNPWNRPAPTLAAPRARNSWLASMLYPPRTVGDQVPTDGLLARRLGYGFLHYQPQLPGTPRGPRAMRMLGRPLRPILFTS